MVAVRISPNLRLVVVGSPAYAKEHGAPRQPRDLFEHPCINIRFTRTGGLYAWELEKAGRGVKVRVRGQLICDDVQMIRRFAIDGFGLAFLMEDTVRAHVERGELVTVLDDWCPPFPGYYLYYSSQRQPSAAFKLLVDALRYRE